MALDDPNIECLCPSCNMIYDGGNCHHCGYLNNTGIFGINSIPDLDPSIEVADILSGKGQTEGVLEILINYDGWVPQKVYIDYYIVLIENQRQITDELPGIRDITFSFREGTGEDLQKKIDIDFDINNFVRKAYYGE